MGYSSDLEKGSGWIEEGLILRRAQEKMDVAWQEPQAQWTLCWYGALPELSYPRRRRP
jgi:hypothetical protein